MTLVTMIRHGQGTFPGPSYDRLSAVGERQARALGDYFAATQRTFDAIYCGTLERQRATAEIVRAGMASFGEPPPVRVRPEFNEYDSRAVIGAQLPGMIAADPTFAQAVANMGTDRGAFRRLLETAMLRWVSGAHDAGRGETWRAFTARALGAIAAAAAENEPRAKIAVFTSGGPISAAMQRSLGLADETTMRLTWRIRNASLTMFDAAAERLNLLLFNATAHLELENDPALLTHL